MEVNRIENRAKQKTCLGLGSGIEICGEYTRNEGVLEGLIGIRGS